MWRKKRFEIRTKNLDTAKVEKQKSIWKIYLIADCIRQQVNWCYDVEIEHQTIAGKKVRKISFLLV